MSLPTAVVLGIVALSASCGLLVWALAVGRDPVPGRVLANLQRGLPAPADEASPVARSASFRLGRYITPPPLVRLTETLYVRAGRPRGWDVDRLLVGKVVLVLVVGFFAWTISSRGSSPLVTVMAMCFVVLAYFVPELLLYSRGVERSEKITLELADTLDQMTIAVEAGLGFDAAMAHAAKNGKGPLSEELVRTLQDVQMGQSRRQAFEALAGRTDVVDLRRFVRAIIQADQHGIALGDVLRTQASEMRLKRRQRAEEKAMKIPVKVVLPLITCILPVLFIVVMGPAAMDVMDAFSNI